MDGKIDIKALRKARGMSQEQVGILAGMSKSQVSRMENGTLGSPATYARVLNALGYQAVVSFQDVRKDTLSDRDRLLSLLKVYFSCNKEAFGIERLGLFGSFARDEAGPDSDVDIVIELAQPDLFRYATIQQQLETVFHRHVDLVSAHAHFPESFQARLEQEAIYV